MSPRPSLSVIIPFFHEGVRLARTLEDVLDYLQHWNAPWEVLLVGEADVGEDMGPVAELLKAHSNVTVHWNPGPVGKGASVKYGVSLARHDLIVFMDADNATRLLELEKVLPLMDAGAEVVIASRTSASTVLVQDIPFVRRCGAGLFRWLYQCVVLPGIKDSQCGFKCFSRAAATTIFSRQTVVGFAFDVELLVIAQLHGYRIHDIPVTWNNDYSTTKSTFLRNARSFCDVVVIAFNRCWGLYRR